MAYLQITLQVYEKYKQPPLLKAAPEVRVYDVV